MRRTLSFYSTGLKPVGRMDCDTGPAAFLGQIAGQKVFLFGGAPEYFDRILPYDK